MKRMNFGCGRRVIDGAFNVDAIRHALAPRDPELIHAIEFLEDGSVANPMPLEDASFDEVAALHVIEHVTAWQAPSLVAEWNRLLRPGGALILELPNLEHAARNLLAGRGDQMSMWPLYGDPGPKCHFNCHRWGYTPASIVSLLTAAGFIKARVLPPQTHGARHDRDMRVEARKPA